MMGPVWVALVGVVLLPGVVKPCCQVRLPVAVNLATSTRVEAGLAVGV